MTVAAFYRFVRLDGLEGLRGRIARLARSLHLKGTVLLAEEGINATLSGARDCLEAFVGELEEDARFGRLPVKYSSAALDNPVFHRLKVRIKPEILSFGQEGVDVAARTGDPVDARRWNGLLDDPGVTVVDVRNGYEIGLGAFPGAVDAGIGHFRDFPEFARVKLDLERNPRVAMYCTGGIRCEKASAWLLNEGCREVYQLDGGILRYLETVPAEENRWEGECFVFDQRVSVDATLGQGPTGSVSPAAPRCPKRTWIRLSTDRGCIAPAATETSRAPGVRAWKSGNGRWNWPRPGVSVTSAGPWTDRNRCHRLARNSFPTH